MNHQFRIVWSVARDAWVVVSEQVRSHAPGTTVLTAGAIALLDVTQAQGYTDPVGAGVTVTAEQVSSGIQHVTAGGVANLTVVQGTFTTVTSTNSSGGTVTSTVQLTSGGVAVSSGGLASGTLVGRGGQITISSGGVAQGTQIHSGGYDNVLNGGLAMSAWVTDNSRSYVNNGGVASATRIDHAGGQYVYGGGVTYDAVISGGGGAFISLHAGTAIGTLVSAGGQLFLQTGSAGNAHILSGGLLTLQGINCVVTGATLESGAAFQANTDSTATGTNALGSFSLVNGIASSVLLENGGHLDVKSGGYASASVVNRGGTLNVFGGGSGTASTINSGGRLVVVADGTALDVTQNSGAALVTNTNATVSGTNALGSFVVSNHNARDVVLENGGSLTVYAGGTASASVSKTGGTLIVSAGGVASATRILNGYEVVYQDGLSLQAMASAGGRQHISAGGSATSALIGASGGQRVYSGGVVNQTTVESGGFQEVSGGTTTHAVFNNGHQSIFSGIATDTTFNSGSQSMTGGVASNTILNSGAVSTVSSSGVASATVINDRATQTVLGGGQASATAIQSGGTQNVSSGGGSLAAIIASGGSQTVFAGGVTSATSVQSGGVQHVSSGGSSLATSVASGGSQTVAGVAQQTSVAGSQTVLAGGVASAGMILSGGVQVLSAGGSDQGSVIGSAGMQTVLAGATTTSATVNAGASQWLSGGMASASTVNGGSQTVFTGGVASATTLVSGGVQTVSSGGSSLGTQIQSGGAQVVSAGGSDQGSVIGSAGMQTVLAGATTTSATVNAGAVQQVSGGVASGTVVQSGGVETIASAGVANMTSVNSGGVVRIAAGASASALDQQRGAALIVDMNALVSGTNALGSFQVGNGASLNVLLENGGSMDVVDGSTASGSTVDSGGTLQVAAGGVLDGVTHITGTGVLGGSSIINRGQLHLSPSVNGVFSAVVSDSGSFYKDGAATLTLATAQNYSGETWVTGGTLTAGVTDAIAASSGLTVQGPGHFDAGGHDQTVNHLRGDGTVDLGEATLTLVQTGGAETFAGTLTGKGGLVKNGAYSQTLSGKTAYTGQTQILAGTLVLDGRLGGARLVSNVVGQSGATLSLVNGAKLTGYIDPLDVGIDKSSSWLMTASSQLDSLTLAGFLDMQRPAGSFIPKTLLLKNLIGQNGVIAMNVALGDSLSTAGQIVIDGGAVTGTLRLGIRNIGGLGDLTTSEGIRLISTVNGGSTAGATVSEYRPVLAGIYDYALVRGTANSDNWYLTSFDPNGQPRIRAEVPLYSVIPSVGLKYGNFLLSSLQERRGSTGVLSGAGSERGWWGRVLTQDNRYTGGSEGILGGGAHFHAKFSAAQYGYDLLDRQTTGYEDRAGLYGAIGKSSTGVSRANGQTAGDMALNGYSVGAYWTRRSTRGWYLDGVMQVTWNQIKTSSVNGETLSTHAPGTILSIEGGYAFQPGLGLTIEPQLQLSWQRLFVAPSRDDAAEVDFGKVQSLPLRLGVKLARDVAWPLTGKPLHVWLQPSVMHEFSSTQTTGFQAMNGNQSSLRSGLSGSSTVIAAGVAGELQRNLALDVKVDYHESLSGNRFHGYGVQLQVHGKF